MKEQFIQIKKRTSTSISAITTTTPTLTFIARNLTSLTINFNIVKILLTNTVEKVILLDLNKTFLNLNAPFIYSLTRDNVIENLGISCHLFNNLKWFQTIYPFNKPYETFNINNIIIYNIGNIVNIPFQTSGGNSVNFRL